MEPPEGGGGGGGGLDPIAIKFKTEERDPQTSRGQIIHAQHSCSVSFTSLKLSIVSLVFVLFHCSAFFPGLSCNAG